ncbi:unnamed protein product [Staurois parvus]|uniref:Uncharacterized protein n=1 Tax=Staurois parvus TaxID=386267 RepID=A0ABN9FIE4_9NEOB|nr:unnamed protein product [Staurois parvus]
MIGTSYRGPVRRSVFHCVRRTQRAPDRGAARSQGARTSRKTCIQQSILSAFQTQNACKRGKSRL